MALTRGAPTLTHTDGSALPTWLTFNSDNRMLTGVPPAPATAVTLTYTVTDSATPPATVILDFPVTVNKGDPASLGFGFGIATVRKIIEEDSSTFTVTVTDDGPGSGAITYTSSDTTVATVDINSGLVTIKAIGRTVITATKEGDDNYNQATATYILRVTLPALLFRIKAFLEGAQ